MTEMFGEAWSPMSVPDLAPDDDDDDYNQPLFFFSQRLQNIYYKQCSSVIFLTVMQDCLNYIIISLLNHSGGPGILFYTLYSKMYIYNVFLNRYPKSKTKFISSLKSCSSCFCFCSFCYCCCCFRSFGDGLKQIGTES